jgi:hypothetical protein
MHLISRTCSLRSGRSVVNFGVAGLTLATLAMPTVAQSTWHQYSPGTRPSARSNFGMSYDAGRDRTVLFGGSIAGGNVKLGDTWEWIGSDWVRRFPTTNPTPRNVLSMAYDAARGRIVMFGGVAATGQTLGDTWEWDGINWHQRTPVHAPTPRSASAMAYDSARDRVMLFGGTVSAGPYNNDTWAWDGADWVQLFPPTSPSPRFNVAMAYDEIRDRIVLFGGEQTGVTLGDTWEWNGASWTENSPASPPPARQAHSMTYHRASGRVVMFGGFMQNDLWSWDGVAWTPGAFGPSLRRAAHIAYESARNRVVLFGGEVFTTISYLDDTWGHGDFTGQAASFTPFGQGCPGTVGVPAHGVALGRPAVGTVYTLKGDNLPPAHVTILWLGYSNTNFLGTPLPFDLGAVGLPNCSLFVSGEDAALLLNLAGTATWPLTIPNNPLLNGVRVYTQIGVLDAVNPLGLIVSNALDSRLGSF